MNINNSIIINSSGISALEAWTSSYYAGVADKNKAMAEFLAPMLTQPTAVAYYTQYDRLSAFELQDTLACPVKGFNEVNPKGENKHVDLEQHGLSSRIMAIEKLRRVPDGNTAAGDMVLQSHSATIANGMSLGILNEIKNQFDTLPATSVNWRDVVNATPIDDLRAMKEMFEVMNGVKPNRILCPQSVLNIIQACDDTLIKLGEYGVKTLTKERLKQLLNYGEDDDIDIRIETIPVNTGAGSANVDMFADRFYMFYATDAPLAQDRTAMRTFLYTESDLLGNMTIEMRESDKSELLSMMTFRKLVVTAPDAFQQFIVQPKTP